MGRHRTHGARAIGLAIFFTATASAAQEASPEKPKGEAALACIENGEKEMWEDAYIYCKEAAYFPDADAKYYYAKSIYMTERSNNRQMVDEALRIATHAYEKGRKDALILIGMLYQKGAFPNYQRSLESFTQAFKEGNAEAAVNIAMLYYDAHKLNNVSKAKEWFKIAADKDSTAGRYGLGLTFFEEGQQKEAAEQFMQAAEAGNAQAMIAVSRFYLNGIVHEQNKIEAIRWMKKAVEAGRNDMRIDLTKLLASLDDSERLLLLRENDEIIEENQATKFDEAPETDSELTPQIIQE